MGVSDKKSEQVYRWILKYIDENRFSGNLKLPSENVICRLLNVSRDTVRKALGTLEQEGVIYKIRGSGTYFDQKSTLMVETDAGSRKLKIGLILQGQDVSANEKLLDGINGILPAETVDLRIFITDNKFSNERKCLQTVIHQNFSGFIVDGVKASILNPNLDCYRELYRRHIPVVFYNNYYKDLKYPHVVEDDMLCAEYLIRLLVQAGHRDIAGVFVYDNYQSVEKFHGFMKAINKYNLNFHDNYIKWYISDDINEAYFLRSIDKFLKNISRCTAIVCCNHMIYRVIHDALHRRGKRIPDDYSVVCFDFSEDELKHDPITCSIHQGNEIGKRVAERLLQMINDRVCYDQGYSCVIEPEIHEGNSILRIQ